MPATDVTEQTKADVTTYDGKVFVRAYPGIGLAPVVVGMTPTEAIGYATDILNKARILIERTA